MLSKLTNCEFVCMRVSLFGGLAEGYWGNHDAHCPSGEAARLAIQASVDVSEAAPNPTERTAWMKVLASP